MNAAEPSESPAGSQPRRPAPFFVIGCVRSGTTMLRNLLRCHPHLACPEETHFYRWPEPFGSAAYARIVQTNPVLRKHREIDGISEAEFADILAKSTTRRDLCDRYMALYIAKNKPGATRWFEKTPQNVYGAGMLGDWKEVRFVHIVRNPVEVAASLRLGKVMNKFEPLGAANYWREAIENITTLRRAYPKRMHEVRYEDFTADPMGELAKLCEFLEEPFDASWFEGMAVKEVSHADESVLSPQEQALVRKLCQKGCKQYGYLPT